MSTVKDVSERIIAAADAKLKAEIEAAAKPLDSLLGDGTSYTINIGTSYEASPGETVVSTLWYRALSALKEAAFEKNVDRCRQQAIDIFMRNVDSVQSQIDELRDQVGGAQ